MSRIICWSASRLSVRVCGVELHSVELGHGPVGVENCVSGAGERPPVDRDHPELDVLTRGHVAQMLQLLLRNLPAAELNPQGGFVDVAHVVDRRFAVEHLLSFHPMGYPQLDLQT
jgi:hypothetical protein